METSLGRTDVNAAPAAAASPADTPVPIVALFSVLVFVSGACALIYQVLWQRQLGLVFGVTTHATSTVLAAFMGGLAAGSLIAGRVADRARHPLLWFAGAEALIGVTALATGPAFTLLQQLYLRLHPLVPVWSLTGVRFITAMVMLLVPALLMGATLPLLVRALVRRVEALGSRLAVLYSLNTAGAIAGTIASAYLFIPALGMSATFRGAALANVGVAAVAIATWWFWTPAGTAPSPPDVEKPQAGERASSIEAHHLPLPARRAIPLIFALSGFVALGLEVVWFRVLLVFQAATAYAFAVMLATVLGGIAAGSAIAPLVLRRRDGLLRRFALLEVAIPIAAIHSLAFLCITYQAGWRTGALLQASALAILPATLVMGCAFPIGVHLWTAGMRDAPERLARRVGMLYAVNVVGGIGGSVAAGFLLLPAFGTRGSLLLLAGLGIAGGALLLAVAVPRRRVVRPLLVTVVLVAAGVWLLPDPAVAVLARRYGGETMLWSDQGVQGAVAVHARPDGTRVLYLDGLHQANDSEGMVRMHREIGALAAALHPAPRTALVVGLGGGVTAGAVASRPGVTVDIVELSEPVVQAATWFSHVNQGILERPSVRVQVNDGRNHLLLAGRRYDLITADIIQPFHAGAGNVYSAEYFRLARAALSDSGVMVQWIGQRPATQYRLIARTFLSVFPDATAWAGGTVLAAGRQPLRLRRIEYDRAMAGAEWRATLDSVGLGTFEALERSFAAGPDALRAFVGDGPLLTDDKPLVEFFRSLPSNDPDIDLSGLRGDPREVLLEEED